MGYSWDARELRISIRDWGRVSAASLQDLGKPVIRASRSGLGIGLLLSHATVERYGGRIELANARDGGTEATLHLPGDQGDREMTTVAGAKYCWWMTTRSSPASWPGDSVVAAS